MSDALSPSAGASKGSAAASVRGPRAGRAGWRTAGRIASSLAVVLALWFVATAILSPPSYVFPSPQEVAGALVDNAASLARHTLVTATEIVLGLVVGCVAGVGTALAIAATPAVRRVVLPAVVVTQTLPVFAIAPLLVIWLGFGMASKIAMAALIIYFPIATAYAEAMARVDPRLIDLARLSGAGPLQILTLMRLPGGLPGFVAGLKVSATVAPIGAVVGEWVGASAGLGYIMLHANARLQTDVLFAALFLLAGLALAVRFAVDALAERMVRWQPSSE